MIPLEGASLATIYCHDVVFDSIEAVVFDKDGTLAQSETYLRTLAQRRSRLIDAQIPGVQDPLLMAFGVMDDQLNPAGLMAVGSRRENEIAAAAYVAETGRDWIESLTLVIAAFQEADQGGDRKAEQTPLCEGATALLDQLTQAGVKLAILSSDSTANVQDFAHCYQLDRHIQLLQGTDAIDGKVDSKADPAFFPPACQQLGVDPRKTLVIGDSAADLQMARQGKAAGFIAMTGAWSQSFSIPTAEAIAKTLADIRVQA